MLALKPYAARYRIAIFEDFDLVAPLAQDALLKTLEEPAAQAIMIVLASAAERVLPTIRSRAQVIPLRPAPLQLIKTALVERGCEEEPIPPISSRAWSGGRTGWALNAIRRSSMTAQLLRSHGSGGEMLDAPARLYRGWANIRLARLKAESEQLFSPQSKRVGKDKAAMRDNPRDLANLLARC